MKTKQTYATPEVEVVNLRIEGVVCTSYSSGSIQNGQSINGDFDWDED